MRRALLGTALIVGCGGLAAPEPRDGGPVAEDGPLACDGAIIMDKSTVNLASPDANLSGIGTVTLTNTGCLPTGEIHLTASPGVIATGCAGSLAAHESCVITITATPGTPAVFSGELEISATPGTGTTPLRIYVITLVGIGPELSVSPGGFDLGPTPLGLPVPPVEVTVSSPSGLSDLTVAASGPDVSLDVDATTCGPVLPAGQWCVVVARFQASSVGEKSDTIVISGGGAAGKVVRIPITANVVTGVFLVVDPSTPHGCAAFAGQACGPVLFVVANRGDTVSQPLSVTVTGTDADEFVATSDCTTLAPLAKCTVGVVFQPPPGSTGQKTATLEVSQFGTTSSAAVAVPLTGVVAPPP